MNNEFYAGHSIAWIQKFIDAVHFYNKRNKKTLRPSRAFCVACAIQHKYTLEKKKVITLDHKILDEFKVSARRLKTYLELFEQAGLLTFSYKMGAAPVITLTSLPYMYVQKNKRIKDKRNLYQSDEVTSTKVCRLPIPKCIGSKNTFNPDKQPRPATKTNNPDQQPRPLTKTSNQDKQPRQGRKS